MSILASNSGYRAWLGALLLEQRAIVRNLLYRVTFLGTPGSMKPSMFGKFLRMVQQISVEKEHENDIISRISEVERQHQLCRARGKLRCAEPPAEGAVVLAPGAAGDMAQPEGSGLDWFVGLVALYLIFRRKPEPRE